MKNEANAHILNHKNVVTLHASIFEPGHYGIVLEFVPNGCLEDYIDQNKVLFNWTVFYVYLKKNYYNSQNMGGITGRAVAAALY